jgi:hypothetical protein
LACDTADAAVTSRCFCCISFVQRTSYDVILVQGVKAVLIPTLFATWLLRKRCIVKVERSQSWSRR